MTPEEKAKELIERYKKQLNDFRASDWRRERIAKQCALICVEEIIQIMSVLKDTYSDDFTIAHNYYKSVKEHLNK